MTKFAILFVGSQVTLPSLSVSTLAVAPSNAIAAATPSTIKNWMSTAHVAMYMPSWTQPWGAPLLFVIISARIRVPTKRIASIGQKLMVPLAESIVSESSLISQLSAKPRNSLTVLQTQSMKYTKKNCTVRLMTHCIVTETGGVYC